MNPEETYQNQFKRLKASNYQAFKKVKTDENGNVIIDAEWLYNNQAYTEWQNYSQDSQDKICKLDYQFTLEKSKAEKLGFLD
ncbi:MAG: hypothetical protein MUC49_13045 [Raineya sp.]|jgi:hypothetical protein|nr:hypothetical protein [Raineya sp.]